MIFYFSGTGNSAYIASLIAQKLNDNSIAINEIWKRKQWSYSLQKGEKLGFIFPVHSWGPPSLVIEVIKRLDLKGANNPYCYMICTCGDDAGCTLHIFRKLLKLKGWKLTSGYSVIMPNTYICLPGFDVDEEKTIKAKLAALPQRLQAIANHISEERQNDFDVYSGHFPKVKSYLIRPLFNRFLLTDKPFYINESCIGCAKCEQACPINNIELKEHKPIWKGFCTTCMLCYHTCPQHAIHYGKYTQNKGQYLKENYD